MQCLCIAVSHYVTHPQGLPLSTGPLRFLLQVVSPREGGPTSLLRSEPGRTPLGEARPPGARIRAPTPGLAPGWGPGCAMPGDVTVLGLVSIIRGFSLTSRLGPVCLGRTYQGHIAPDNIAPRVIRV